ncbi:hypothetical protein CCMSSC00406_0005900 [Pleurotus cornucopiae]|uniref:Uncharacterized protein n=1 Tax=Pleurotus cornucopiae TaxID=5321 RepID=A0ACB7IJ73_PLECO|nr:hypothetical protein CCMSSC00406_0005900 [Pleurotus cornucopiae]
MYMDHPLQAYEEDDRISTWLNSLDVSALHDGEGLEGGEYPYTEPALRADSPLEGWLSPSDANTDIIKPATTSPNALLNPSPDYARRLPSPAPPNVNEGEDEGLDAKKDEERERENEEDALRELLYHLRLPEPSPAPRTCSSRSLLPSPLILSPSLSRKPSACVSPTTSRRASRRQSQRPSRRTSLTVPPNSPHRHAMYFPTPAIPTPTSNPAPASTSTQTLEYEEPVSPTTPTTPSTPALSPSSSTTFTTASHSHSPSASHSTSHFTSPSTSVFQIDAGSCPSFSSFAFPDRKTPTPTHPTEYGYSPRHSGHEHSLSCAYSHSHSSSQYSSTSGHADEYSGEPQYYGGLEEEYVDYGLLGEEVLERQDVGEREGFGRGLDERGMSSRWSLSSSLDDHPLPHSTSRNSPFPLLNTSRTSSRRSSRSPYTPYSPTSRSSPSSPTSPNKDKTGKKKKRGLFTRRISSSSNTPNPEFAPPNTPVEMDAEAPETIGRRRRLVSFISRIAHANSNVNTPIIPSVDAAPEFAPSNSPSDVSLDTTSVPSAASDREQFEEKKVEEVEELGSIEFAVPSSSSHDSLLPSALSVTIAKVDVEKALPPTPPSSSPTPPLTPSLTPSNPSPSATPPPQLPQRLRTSRSHGTLPLPIPHKRERAFTVPHPSHPQPAQNEQQRPQLRAPRSMGALRTLGYDRSLAATSSVHYQPRESYALEEVEVLEEVEEVGVASPTAPSFNTADTHATHLTSSTEPLISTPREHSLDVQLPLSLDTQMQSYVLPSPPSPVQTSPTTPSKSRTSRLNTLNMHTIKLFGLHAKGRGKKRKLVVSGIEDERGYEAVRAWCEAFGQVRSFAPSSSGDGSKGSDSVDPRGGECGVELVRVNALTPFPYLSPSPISFTTATANYLASLITSTPSQADIEKNFFSFAIRSPEGSETFTSHTGAVIRCSQPGSQRRLSLPNSPALIDDPVRNQLFPNHRAQNPGIPVCASSASTTPVRRSSTPSLQLSRPSERFPIGSSTAYLPLTHSAFYLASYVRIHNIPLPAPISLLLIQRLVHPHSFIYLLSTSLLPLPGLYTRSFVLYTRSRSLTQIFTYPRSFILVFPSPFFLVLSLGHFTTGCGQGLTPYTYLLPMDGPRTETTSLDGQFGFTDNHNYSPHHYLLRQSPSPSRLLAFGYYLLLFSLRIVSNSELCAARRTGRFSSYPLVVLL